MYIITRATLYNHHVNKIADVPIATEATCLVKSTSDRWDEEMADYDHKSLYVWISSKTIRQQSVKTYIT